MGWNGAGVLASVWVPKGRDEWEEERRPEKMMDALTKRARARNLGARGGGGCSVQLAQGSPSPPPTHPRRAAPAAIPVKIFSRKSAKNGSLLLTWSHAITLSRGPTQTKSTLPSRPDRAAC